MVNRYAPVAPVQLRRFRSLLAQINEGDLMYSKTLYAGWGDMDFNSHMANTCHYRKPNLAGK